MDGSTARRPPRAPLDEACARKLSASSASGPPSARYGKLVALAQSLSASAAANANASAAGGEGGGGGASDAAGTVSVPPLPPKPSSRRGSGAGPSGAPAGATATQLAATSGGAPGPVGVLGATARHAKPPSRGRAQSGDLEIFALFQQLMRDDVRANAGAGTDPFADFCANVVERCGAADQVDTGNMSVKGFDAWVAAMDAKVREVERRA